MSGKKLIITVKDLYNFDREGDYKATQIFYHAYENGRKIHTGVVSGKSTSGKPYVQIDELPDCLTMPVVEIQSMSPHTKVTVQVVDFDMKLPEHLDKWIL